LLHRVVRFLPAVLVAAALAAVPFAYSRAREQQLGNFHVVEEGVLYRSAQPSPAGLERVVHDYGIRTVITFRDVEGGKSEEPPAPWEPPLCARLGVNFHRFPIRLWWDQDGTGIPADANVAAFLKIMAEPANRPVLVHCFKGIHRTGMYCAVYRMECQGWSNDDAIAELRERGYVTLDRDTDARGYLEQYVPGRREKKAP
jgi:protein tyrosine/serine phosphatase